jgi:hypothetical protein
MEIHARKGCEQSLLEGRGPLLCKLLWPNSRRRHAPDPRAQHLSFRVVSEHRPPRALADALSHPEQHRHVAAQGHNGVQAGVVVNLTLHM